MLVSHADDVLPVGRKGHAGHAVFMLQQLADLHTRRNVPHPHRRQVTTLERAGPDTAEDRGGGARDGSRGAGSETHKNRGAGSETHENRGAGPEMEVNVHKRNWFNRIVSF